MLSCYFIKVALQNQMLIAFKGIANQLFTKLQAIKSVTITGLVSKLLKRWTETVKLLTRAIPGRLAAAKC